MTDAAGEGLTVAVIHHRTPQLLEECLRRVRAAAPRARLLLVDTSEDRSLAAWRSRPADVELLEERNHSYAASVNAALRRCTTPLFAFLNADVLVAEDTFAVLAAALQRSGAAVAGPLLVDASGRLQRHGPVYRAWQWQAGRSRAYASVPWLSGALQCLRVDAARRVGGLDASLRFYNEDVEWCLRLRRAGERCVLVRHQVVHLGGASTPGRPQFLIEGLRGGYRLSQRFRGPLPRRAHRLAVLATAALLARLGRAERRAAYGQVLLMFRRGEFVESPFGDTLSQSNPRFQIGRAE